MDNDAMKGYVILACESCGINKDTIERILGELDFVTDKTTEYEAELAYYKFKELRRWKYLG